MAEDSRESGRPVSGTIDVAGGDSSLETVVELRDEETLSISEVRVQYDQDGSVNSQLEIYDEPSDINQGDEEDILDKFHLTPGDTENADMVYSDVENDVLATADGNQDAAITVTIGGYIVTG